MSISELSIRRPVLAWMLMASLIIFGGISFFRMGISQLPDVDFPVVTVNMRLEGAAPQVIETEIVDFVEDAVMGIEGVKTVTSRSENSEGTITIEFELSRSLDLAVQDVQAKLSQIASKLPRDVTGVTVRKTNPDDQPIMLLTLESNKYSLRDLMYYVSDRLKGQFSMVAGVGDIGLRGYVDPNLRIWVDSRKLREHQLTVEDVIATAEKEHSEMPAGQVNDLTGQKMYYVRAIGEATTPKEFEDLVINTRGGGANLMPFKLKEVARVEDGTADVLGYSRARGVPGVALAIMKQRGSNAVAVAKGIRARLDEIRKGLPEGMELKINFDSTKYIEEAVHELNFTLLLSALLTALVCWVFLGSWASTFNVLLSIPTSIIGTFIFLYFAGFTLNSFTLMGLSLSIGIVVDDAIMVLENIIRHQEKGENRVLAALIGTKEITFAALAATLSIIAIFLPVIFMNGVIGKFFFQFGITMTVAVLLSLLEALTLTPMRCSQFVGIHQRTTRLGIAFEKALDGFTSFYERSLKAALNHPWKVLAVSITVCALSFGTLRFLNKEFLPMEDQSRFIVRLKTPIGSSLQHSGEAFKAVEDFLATRSEVDRYVLQVGGGSPGDANSGNILVTMKAKGSRGIDSASGHELSQAEFMDVVRAKFKPVKTFRAVVQDLSSRAFSASRGFPVEFTVEGPEWDELAKYSAAINDELEKTGLVTDVDSNYDSAMPELQVVPDRKAAEDRAVSIATISNTVNAMMGGALVGRYPKGGHRYDIRVKIENPGGDPFQVMNGLSVRNNRGELVRLSDVAHVQQKSSMVEINRLNRERAVTTYANVKTGGSQQKALQAVEDIGKRLLPPQYHIVFSGSSQTFNESFTSLIVALVLGLLVAYMILASQFNSFVDPLIVLMALPFSVSGAFVAMLVAHQSINIYSMIGLILLMGIVKKNSILLVDFSNQVRAEDGLNARDSLLKACPIRLRPILMTSVATIAGAIPAAIALGPGAESRAPMADAVIGGVLVSTLLTLYVVPCAYLLMTSRRKKEIAFEDKIQEKSLVV
jgi:hydrophobe/amphiphile efflux-1 (HAE1) family protein